MRRQKMQEDRDLISFIYIAIAILTMLISLSMKMLVNEIGRLYFNDLIMMLTL